MLPAVLRTRFSGRKRYLKTRRLRSTNQFRVLNHFLKSPAFSCNNAVDDVEMFGSGSDVVERIGVENDAEALDFGGCSGCL